MDQHKVEIIPAWKTNRDKIYFGYCGNCGSPHSENFIKQVMNEMDPVKHHMILAVYGTKAEQLKQFAKNNPAVTILSSVPRGELHHIDVQLITLINSWTHVAVPSKAVSCICSGSAMFFCGQKESDNWYLLQDAGWQVDDDHEL